jgi:uncharacterized protein YjbI with pentapeptide repeats
MRMLHHGAVPKNADLAWFFRVAPAKAGAPVLVVSGSMLLSHTEDPPARRETPESAAHRLAPRKVKGDLLVTGQAHANPDETGNRRYVPIALEMGKWRKALAVFGDRVWLPGALSTTISEPRRFDSMPVTYDRAYGGPGFDWNPIGMGAGPGPRGQMLPNIEWPNRRILTPKTEQPPAGFGAIDRAWRPRADKLGTHDAAWLAEYWPGPPPDFDPEYWNAAPADQQFAGGFRGDEVLHVENMHPNQPRFALALPGLALRAFVAKADGAFEELSMMLDTFAVDMEAGQSELVWRGALAVRSARLRDIAFLFTLAEPLAKASPLAQCQAIFETLRRKQYPNAAEREADAQAARAAASQAASSAQAALAADLGKAAALTASLDGLAAAARAKNPPPARHLRGEVPAPHPLPPAQQAKHAATLAMLTADLTSATPNAAGWTRERVQSAHAAGADMSGADLSGLDLSGLDLHGATVAGADFSGAQATGTDFSGAKLAGAKFAGATLAGAIFKGAQIAGADFSALALEGLCFNAASGAQAIFAGAKLNGASFLEAILPQADFSKSSLAGAIFDGAYLAQANFVQVLGEGAQFRRATLENIRANSADFRRGVFTGVTAPRSVWQQAQLTRAEFPRATLLRANFCEAELDHAIFDRALLEDAKFDEANLIFAAVTNAKLVRASFERADLRDADFSGSNLYQAGLFGARSSRLRLEGSFLAGTLMAR